MSNNKQKPKKAGLPLPASGTPTRKLAVIAGIVFILLIFFIVLMNILGRSGEDKAVFVNIVHKQTELMRVADMGVTDASVGQSIKNTSINLETVTSSDKQTLVAALANKKITLKGKDLSGMPDQGVDTRLADAKAAANFSSTLLTILQEQLTDYRSTLEQAYDQTKSKTLKDSLSQIYGNTDQLKKQLDATKP